MKNNYIDLYLLPVPKKNINKYKKIATTFGKLSREYGALDYREFIGEDLFPKGTISFTKASPIKSTEYLISAVVSFKSRSHRDLVMQKMFKDPRMEKMANNKPIADMKKMYYGGFEAIVNV